jgi:curli biogenesis system outer membrane secretion channel CsgG
MNKGILPGLLLIAGLAGSVGAAAPQKSQPYSGPKARLSVSEIRDKTAAGGLSAQIMEKYHMPWKEIGEGMRDMLTTALFKSKRFALLERAILDEVMKEQDLAASGRVQQGTGAATGGIVGADLIVAGAVTEFVTDALTVKAGTEALGTDIDGSMTKGYVTLDIRVIDAKTSEIVVATRVTGRTSDYGLEATPEEDSKLPLSLSIFTHKPAERAIRSAIQKAVTEIIKLTPPEYFRN